MRRVLLSSLCCLALVACATPNYRAKHQTKIVSDVGEEFQGDIRFDEVGREDIPLYAELEPTGFTFDQEQGALSVAEGSGHEVLKRVNLNFPVMENPARLLWFAKFRPEQRWRKGLCYWQTPLVWVTLTIWMIVPLHYACQPNIVHTGGLREIGGKEKRRGIMFRGLQAEALRLKGNAVIGVKITDQGANGWVVRLAEGTPAPGEVLTVAGVGGK